MSNRRYHIHVICTAHDQPQVLDSLAIFFQKSAFLTYDIVSQLSKASTYSRQNIDSCDYIVLVIGDNYGASSSVFVSQMHLSYLSAKAKLKPMFALIKTHNEEVKLSWQLLDFTHLVERQTNHIYYYNDDTDIEQLLSYANSEMLQRNDISASWLHQSQSTPSESQKNKATAPILNKKNDLSSSTLKGQRPQVDDSLKHVKLSSKPVTAVADKANTTNSNELDISLESSKADIDTDILSTPIQLTDTIELSYSAQAYEGGNLSDLTMSTTLTWQQVLTALAEVAGAFSNYGLQRCFNRLIADNVEAEIKSLMPNVHAISRCRIAEEDLVRLQRLLVAANWIQIVTSATRSSQELWKLTFYAKNLYDEQR